MSENHLEKVLFVTDKGEVAEAVLVGLEKSLCIQEAKEEFKELKLRPAGMKVLHWFMQQHPEQFSNRRVVAFGDYFYVQRQTGVFHSFAGPTGEVLFESEFRKWHPDDRFLGFVIRDKPQPEMFRMC